MVAFMFYTIFAVLEHNRIHKQSIEHKLSVNMQEVQGFCLLLPDLWARYNNPRG